MLEDLSEYFENLYKTEDPNDLLKTTNVKYNTNIPILDDPISKPDIDEAIKNMKKVVMIIRYQY